MKPRATPQQVLDQEFLTLRAKVLELAAAFDRVDRGEGTPADAEKMDKLRSAIETLLRPGTNRAEQIQLLFSRPYQDDWRTTMGV